MLSDYNRTITDWKLINKRANVLCLIKHLPLTNLSYINCIILPLHTLSFNCIVAWNKLRSLYVIVYQDIQETVSVSMRNFKQASGVGKIQSEIVYNRLCSSLSYLHLPLLTIPLLFSFVFFSSLPFSSLLFSSRKNVFRTHSRYCQLSWTLLNTRYIQRAIVKSNRCTARIPFNQNIDYVSLIWTVSLWVSLSFMIES